MNAWRDVTLGSLIAALSRYRTFALTIGIILVLAVVAPGTTQQPRDSAAGPGLTATVGGQTASGLGSAVPGAPDSATSGPADVSSSARALTGTATRTATAGSAAGASPALQQAGEVAGDPLAVPDCDPATQRIKAPSVFAAPCVPLWPKGEKAGSTYQGVTDDKIVVAIRWSQGNPAVAATLTAAGAEDTQEDVRETRQDWSDFFEAHYETYGRKVEFVYFESSGSDEQAQRADAIKVATEIKAFSAWGGGGAYRDELVARKILCLCGATLQDQYLEMAPYTWGTQPSLQQWFTPVAEYVGKKLWGLPARFAGNPVFQQSTRTFGIVYADSATTPVTVKGIEFLDRELSKYGAKLSDKISYVGDINTAQEQARTIIARLKDRNITTVMFWGDPLAPIFLTQEATRQNYFPEWMITGGNLVDTTFFGRTYDQVQWSRAFGVSQLWARGPQVTNEVYNMHVWHHERPPTAEATYEIIFQSNWMFYTGLHLAGPVLTPHTFAAGLFAFPLSGGGPLNPRRSFGDHGLWPFEDYTAFDDNTEVWWDPNAVGENEIGQQGKGMWRYVDGGKRYLAGQWPAGESNLFETDGTITKYDKTPPEDQYPEYEHKHYR